MVWEFFGESAAGMFFEMVQVMLQGEVLKRFRGMVQPMVRGLIREMV